jgi:hypothetical protein
MSTLKLVAKQAERRAKTRFPIHRELRYKSLKDGVIMANGAGQTVNIGSGGVCFAINKDLEPETYVELSISWPVLLDDSCPMRLIVFGRVLRSSGGKCACTVDKYEFRTQSRVFQTTPSVRNDSMLQRWAEGVRKENLKTRTMAG